MHDGPIKSNSSILEDTQEILVNKHLVTISHF